MREDFEAATRQLETCLRGSERFTAHFAAETSDFVRINGAAVRQAGSVVQRSVEVDWIDGRRHATGELTLAGHPAIDRPRLTELAASLRERLAAAPEDPFLLENPEACSTEVARDGDLPEAGCVVDSLLGGAKREGELVGIYAAGDIVRGFTCSTGQRNWFRSASFHLDWSLHAGDSAVKAGYAGTAWSADELARRDAEAREQLRALARPPRALDPGRYRTYLAPAAVDELVGLLGWGGFGLRAHRTAVSPLLRLARGEAALSDAVSLREHAAGGIAPNFERAGFLRPDTVTLVEDGRFADWLVSPPSAVEYGAETNGAEPDEAPLSLELAPGALPRDDVLRELGTGLYVGNLWYLSYSDRPACRTTGMTRFATFWVEDGALAGPVAPMRFDDTLYHLLGRGLEALTREREEILDPASYGRRSTRSARLPGVLVDGLAFTL